VSTAISAADEQAFRTVLARRLGLTLEGCTAAALTELLRCRVGERGMSRESYLGRLETDGSWDEVRALARALTVPETYFLRNPEQFLALAEVVLPQRMGAAGATGRLRLLSVGCASGEEAYTLAMVVRDVVPARSWQVSIVGVDINELVLQTARRGRYGPWALRAVPDHLRQRWFRSDGQTMVLDEEIRRAVRFVERNLVDDDAELWVPDAYDVIFCRNVIMYLTPECGRTLLDRMIRSLAPGGFLFMGHAESLRDRGAALEVHHTHGTFYYRRHRGPPDAVMRSSGSVTSLDHQHHRSDDWMASIAAANGRIRALVDDRRAPAPAATSARARSVAPGWARALELMERECFADALSEVESCPAEVRDRPDGMVLRAALLVQCGRMALAEEVCGLLLDRDGLNAGAHYLLGLCHESRGDADGAVDHDRMAVYLDPTFAMPRLRLGILARRRGDVDSARRELGLAQTLLAREERHRILLFGGGFARPALIALCRAELATCRVAP
jgi:chemotaxis protein methyltransferase CheR